MNHFNKRILWADDKEAVLTDVEKTLTAFFEKKQINCQIDKARDGKEVYKALSDNVHYDLVILDLNMKHWGGVETITLLAKEYPLLKIIVVSSELNIDKNKKILPHYINDGIILGAYSLDDIELWLSAIEKFLSDVNPYILHFSDIHFGKYHAFNDNFNIINNLKLLLQELNDNNPKPNLVVISGDLTSECLDPEYDKAKDFIKDISEILNLTLDKFVIVPGNHELNRSERNIKRRFDKYIEFLNLTKSLNGGNILLPRYPKLYDKNRKELFCDRYDNQEELLYTASIYHEHRVIIVGFNSIISDEALWNEGRIPHKQLLNVKEDFIKEKTKNKKLNDYIKIAVFHHHLFPIPAILEEENRSHKDRVLMNQGIVLKELALMGFSIVLHGHSHYQSGCKYQLYFLGSGNKKIIQPINIFSTGTLSGKHLTPSKSYFNFNSLYFDLKHDKDDINLNVTTYELPLDSLEWRKDSIMIKPNI
jgi:CheY-like chemotaxis protein